jgi:hypothetical protein
MAQTDRWSRLLARQTPVSQGQPDQRQTAVYQTRRLPQTPDTGLQTPRPVRRRPVYQTRRQGASETRLQTSGLAGSPRGPSETRLMPVYLRPV